MSTLNGQDFDKFLEDVVLMESDVEISQHITFVENLTVLENVVIDYNLDAPTILTYNLQDWVDNAVYLDRNMTVTGKMYICNIVYSAIDWMCNDA